MGHSKYSKEIIERIAQEIDMGMLCYLNTDPLVLKSVPDDSFKFVIDNSLYRQNWFDFKQAQLEQLVLEQLI